MKSINSQRYKNGDNKERHIYRLYKFYNSFQEQECEVDEKK